MPSASARSSGTRTLFQSGSLLVALALALMPLAMAQEAARPNTLTAAEIADGWILLFDGETLFGWQPATKVNWEVAGGVISASEGEVGLLNTTSEFADYVLKVDFRASKGCNSGVFLRTAATPKDPAGDCYELNIAPPENPFPTGSFVKRSKVEGAGETDGWRTFEVTAQGAKFTVKLDGKQVLEFTDEKPLGRGPIGLQFNMGKVEFRNVKLKPLSLKDLFNGKDLTGWTVLKGEKEKSVYSVTPEGAVNVKNGPGQLESQAQFGDFVMQVECIANGKHLNSGIFFRSIPGERWNGYESQVHNGYKDGDRTKPMDFGTGGFYRRQPARKVVADDFQWFSKTVVVSGAHMAGWVNGYQVSDWTDERKPDANPRNGLRTEAGTLIIQGPKL
jgi:hypothetical protein